MSSGGKYNTVFLLTCHSVLKDVQIVFGPFLFLLCDCHWTSDTPRGVLRNYYFKYLTVPWNYNTSNPLLSLDSPLLTAAAYRHSSWTLEGAQQMAFCWGSLQFYKLPLLFATQWSEKMGITEHLVILIRNLYRVQTVAVQPEHSEKHWLHFGKGMR